MKLGAKAMPHPSFKAALHETVFRSTLPAKALADLVGVSYSALTQFADEAVDTQIPVRRLVALVATADNRAVLDYLEALAGRLAFEIPRGAHLSSAAAAIREFGEWIAAHASALADDQVSADELAVIEREGQEAIAAIAAALEHARARAPKPLRAVGEDRR